MYTRNTELHIINNSENELKQIRHTWYQQNIVHWLWSPYVIGQTIIFSSCSFFMVALCNRETIYIFMLWFVMAPYVIGGHYIFAL